jgi:hypothetical protein
MLERGTKTLRTIGKLVRGVLPAENPTAVAFLDESGAIANDQFFAVGCLKLPEPAPLTRGIQRMRDRRQWYHELHWVALTKGALPVYEAAVDVVAGIEDARFSCFVADRSLADPVARFGNAWRAYEKLAEQLLMGTIKPWEIVSVLADDYSAPAGVDFEGDLKSNVNRRLGRLAVSSVCRLNSKSADPLQIVDLLTAAVAFEFKQAAGLAGKATPKAALAAYVRKSFGVPSVLGGYKDDRFNVAIYQQTLAAKTRP